MNRPNEIFETMYLSYLYSPFFFRYTDDVENLSTLMKLEPNPMNEAIKLLEYLSVTKGGEHLKLSSRHLNFFQYHSLDFIALCIFSCIVSALFWKLVIFKSRRKGVQS